MDQPEASKLLGEKLDGYRRLSYAELVARIGTEDRCEVIGPSGAEYQIEIDCLWDGAPGGAVRIMGSIDDGGWRAFCPLCQSFAVGPEQSS